MKELISRLKSDGIGVSTHFVPLHSAPGGKRFARTSGELEITERVASTLVRMPMFYSLQEATLDYIADRTTFHARKIQTDHQRDAV